MAISLQSGHSVQVGAYGGDDWIDEEGWFDPRTGLPLTNRDQSCAFCGVSGPRFAHRLDPERVQFRVYGDGNTLPGFWCVCEDCEQRVASGDDAELLRLMHKGVEWEDPLVQQAALEAFRAADLGVVSLRDVR